MAKAKDFFKKVAQSKGGGKGGTYFDPNFHYLVEIDKVVETGDNKEFLAIEGHVVASDNPEQGKGYSASQVIKLMIKPAADNIASFMKPAYDIYTGGELDCKNLEHWDGIDEETGDYEIEAMYDAMVAEDNIFKGLRIYLRTKGITTKEKKNPFTIHDWGKEAPPSWEEAPPLQEAA